MWILDCPTHQGVCHATRSRSRLWKSKANQTLNVCSEWSSGSVIIKYLSQSLLGVMKSRKILISVPRDKTLYRANLSLIYRVILVIYIDLSMLISTLTLITNLTLCMAQLHSRWRAVWLCSITANFFFNGHHTAVITWMHAGIANMEKGRIAPNLYVCAAPKQLQNCEFSWGAPKRDFFRSKNCSELKTGWTTRAIEVVANRILCGQNRDF